MPTYFTMSFEIFNHWDIEEEGFSPASRVLT